jgi:hypothetical protein
MLKQKVVLLQSGARCVVGMNGKHVHNAVETEMYDNGLKNKGVFSLSLIHMFF